MDNLAYMVGYGFGWCTPIILLIGSVLLVVGRVGMKATKPQFKKRTR